MKALMKVLFVAALASLTVVGCGDKKGGSGNSGGYNDYNYFSNNGKVGDQFEGRIQFVNGGQTQYQRMLEETTGCDRNAFFGLANTCNDNNRDRAPFIKLTFLSRETAQSYGGFPTHFDLNPFQGFGNSNSAYLQPNTTLFPVANNMFEANFGTGISPMRLSVAGEPDDNQITVKLSHGGREIGEAILTRTIQYNNQFNNPYQQPYNSYRGY